MERTILAMFVFFCIALQYFPTATVVTTASCPNIKSRSSVELPDLYEASISELQAGLQAGAFTSVDLVTAYFARIKEVSIEGPKLNAVIETNPNALAQAARLDAERRKTGPRGPLHGIPIILKDNIATEYSEGMNTTAGSLALVGSVVPRDAMVAAKLRSAGAILLGKASLSEWSAIRGKVPAGFSGRGGQCTSPYLVNGNPSGSSSGSGVCSAIGLAAGALGTETDGSIISPSERNNIVGLKPTVGLTSRAGVIPISSHQDSVGPMTRTVADAAAILTIISGKDPLDKSTDSQPDVVPDFSKALNPYALKGARIGIPRLFQGNDPNILASFNEAVEIIRSLGATITDPTDLKHAREIMTSNAENIIVTVDFKVEVNKYISDLVEVPTGVKNLADLIQFNKDHAEEELISPFYKDQSQFIDSEESTMNDAYYEALAKVEILGRKEGIDEVFKREKLDALLLPSAGFTSGAPAIAGYPIITVPLGFQPDSVLAEAASPIIWRGPGIPFGISFIGTAFSEFKLISFAYAYEQETHNRLKRLAFAEAIPKHS